MLLLCLVFSVGFIMFIDFIYIFFVAWIISTSYLYILFGSATVTIKENLLHTALNLECSTFQFI